MAYSPQNIPTTDDRRQPRHITLEYVLSISCRPHSSPWFIHCRRSSPTPSRTGCACMPGHALRTSGPWRRNKQHGARSTRPQAACLESAQKQCHTSFLLHMSRYNSHVCFVVMYRRRVAHLGPQNANLSFHECHEDATLPRRNPPLSPHKLVLV